MTATASGSARLRRLALDWAVPVAIVGIGVGHVAIDPRSPDFPGSPAVHVAFLAGAAAILGYRRRAPLAAPLLAVAVVTVWVAGMWPADAQGPFEGFLVLVVVAYCVGADPRRGRHILGAVLLGAYLAANQVVLAVYGGGVGDLLPLVVWMAMAWAAGLVLNQRVEQARDERARAATLAVGHELRTAEAVEQERARIARELHDVVAHSLSVIVVQSAGERRALERGNADNTSASGVLESVERTARDALVDLRRLLGLLRQGSEPPSLTPQPTLAELDALVGQVDRAGVRASLIVEGDRPALPAGVELTAYRIVQESLTNALKHAHATRVDVTVCYGRSYVGLLVSDDGRAGADESGSDLPGAGHGLLGMRERVAVFGGTFEAGPRPEGGWTVQARLPADVAVLEST